MCGGPRVERAGCNHRSEDIDSKKLEGREQGQGVFNSVPSTGPGPSDQ